tara:strand:+ start:2109 stop:2816 length:708 start_codon:yes stop_codon:yes gene_type:complete
MSTNSCFETLHSTIVNGSDQTNSRRQKTIYVEMQNNSKKNGPNPVKKNGGKYNQNFISKHFKAAANTQNIPENQYRLASAKNYELLLDITKGKRLVNPVKNVGANRYKTWGGNVMQVDYTNSAPIKPVSWTKLTDNSLSNDVYIATNDVITISNELVDPLQQIFYAPCYFSTPGHTPPWIQNVATKTPIFKNTYYYLQGANADPLRGMSYPEEIYFEQQSPCIQEDTVCPPHLSC